MGAGYIVPSSEIATATPAAAMAKPGYLHGVLLISDGTNDPKVILYDDPDSAHGTVLAEISFDVSQSGKFTDMIPFPKVRCENGIWAVVTGTGATAIVYSEEKG